MYQHQQPSIICYCYYFSVPSNPINARKTNHKDVATSLTLFLLEKRLKSAYAAPKYHSHVTHQVSERSHANAMWGPSSYDLSIYFYSSEHIQRAQGHNSLYHAIYKQTLVIYLLPVMNHCTPLCNQQTPATKHLANTGNPHPCNHQK